MILIHSSDQSGVTQAKQMIYTKHNNFIDNNVAHTIFGFIYFFIAICTYLINRIQSVRKKFYKVKTCLSFSLSMSITFTLFTFGVITKRVSSTKPIKLVVVQCNAFKNLFDHLYLFSNSWLSWCSSVLSFCFSRACPVLAETISLPLYITLFCYLCLFSFETMENVGGFTCTHWKHNIRRNTFDICTFGKHFISHESNILSMKIIISCRFYVSKTTIISMHRKKSPFEFIPICKESRHFKSPYSTVTCLHFRARENPNF